MDASSASAPVPAAGADGIVDHQVRGKLAKGEVVMKGQARKSPLEQRAKAEGTNTLKISVIRDTLQDEWVAAEVTKVDNADGPAAGRIITHSPTKHLDYDMVKAYLGQHQATGVFIFFAGDPIPEGVEVALAIG